MGPTYTIELEPAEMSVVAYVKEEVSRQHHDTTRIDGIERVGWMLNGWSYALHRSVAKESAPTMFDALNIGRFVEPLRNPDGLRSANVQVRTNTGIKRFPDYERVPDLLKALFEQRDAMPPLEFYREFENIHPFMDGNGRTGKILLNWLNGSLLDPVFPPHNLFGEWIINP